MSTKLISQDTYLMGQKNTDDEMGKRFEKKRAEAIPIDRFGAYVTRKKENEKKKEEEEEEE